MKRLYAVLVIVGVAILMAAPALYAQDVNTAIELLRTDVNAKEKDILIKAMKLTEKESTVFWPLYRNYKNDRSKITDERIVLLKEYASQYERMTDAKATELMNKLFSLEGKMLDLKQKYFKEMSKALSARTAARFIQAENYMAKLVDLSIGGEVPLMPKPEDIKPEAPTQGGSAK